METQKHTREKILWQALRLFATKGYGGTSVREITTAVGIQESSLYNHFKSKQDLLNAIVDYGWQRAKEFFDCRKLPFRTQDDLSPFFQTGAAFEQAVLQTFSYFFEDEYNVLFRRLLLLCQYEDERIQRLYRTIFQEYFITFQTQLFSKLMEAGKLRKADPAATARLFYGTVFLLMHTCDSFEEAAPLLLSHLHQFLACYSLTDPE